MTPSRVLAVRARPPLRPVARAIAIGSLVLGAVLVATSGAPAAPVTVPLARRLEPARVAVAIPLAWLAAPLPGLGVDDRLDIVGVRPGDAASVYPLAEGARVLEEDGRSLVLAVRSDDAAQLALARASSLLLVPLLRPSR